MGWTNAPVTSGVRATAQSLPGPALATDTDSGRLTLRWSGGYLKAGSFKTCGSREPGRPGFTYSGPGTTVQYAPRPGRCSLRAVRLPYVTGTRTYVATDDFDRRATAAVKVLGRKSLWVSKTKSRVKR